LHQELLAVTDPLPFDFEFIVIDNPAPMKLAHWFKALCQRDLPWKYIRFSRNFT